MSAIISVRTSSDKLIRIKRRPGNDSADDFGEEERTSERFADPPVDDLPEPEPPDDLYETEPPIDDLPETDLEIMRDARHRQAKQAANDAYGETETVIGDKGRAIVKPRFAPPSLQELLLLAKIKRAERASERFERREARGSNASEVVSKENALETGDRRARPEHGSAGAVKQFLASARKPAPAHTPAIAPVSSRSGGWSWLRRHFGTPKRPVWR